MLKKTITYTNYNDLEVTEDFYFNLTKAEVLQMETEMVGGYSSLLRRIVDSKDSESIINTFKQIISKAYGEKTPDGRRFMKSPEISRAFEETEAYSELYVELFTNVDAAVAFINGIMPPKPKKDPEFDGNPSEGPIIRGPAELTS